MSSPNESACPDCGEMVRVNSLRCWNCGGFMNPDLEAKFMEMQAKPQEIIYSEMPDNEVVSYEDDEDDDDFELTAPAPAAIPVPNVSAETPPAEAPAPAATPKRPTQPNDLEIDHSVATGGDALLDIAISEEKESRQKRRARKQTGGMKTPGGGIIIFCPYGCKIEVKEQHRGMSGRCPKCRAPFLVPIDPPNYKVAKEKADTGAATESAAANVAGGYGDWLHDFHLHVVNPEKLKLKADSLLKDFVSVDVGFSPDRLLIYQLAAKKGGLFGGGGAKGEDPRDEILKHLKEGKTVDELPVASKYLFEKNDLQQIKVVQPVANRADSMFHGVPIFGEGRIALQLPMTDEVVTPIYLSVGITQFWDLQKQLEAHYGLTGLGAGAGIPPEHVYSDARCHFLETQIKVLENLEFYEADPSVELITTGYRCGACGLTVSEDGRKKESLGGKSPKGIAKAKCPKCGSKMGDNQLKTIKTDIEETSMAAAE